METSEVLKWDKVYSDWHNWGQEKNINLLKNVFCIVLKCGLEVASPDAPVARLGRVEIDKKLEWALPSCERFSDAEITVVVVGDEDDAIIDTIEGRASVCQCGYDSSFEDEGRKGGRWVTIKLLPGVGRSSSACS